MRSFSAPRELSFVQRAPCSGSLFCSLTIILSPVFFDLSSPVSLDQCPSSANLLSAASPSSCSRTRHPPPLCKARPGSSTSSVSSPRLEPTASISVRRSTPRPFPSLIRKDDQMGRLPSAATACEGRRRRRPTRCILQATEVLPSALQTATTFSPSSATTTAPRATLSAAAKVATLRHCRRAQPDARAGSSRSSRRSSRSVSGSLC